MDGPKSKSMHGLPHALVMYYSKFWCQNCSSPGNTSNAKNPRRTTLEMEEDPEANLENFLEWATELGISDSSQSEKSVRPVSSLGQSLHLSYFPDAGGRGLAAVRDLRKGELILRVPKSALVTTESLLRDSQALSDAVQKHHFVSSTQMLAVALLNEVGKGKSSSWYPYLLQIPRNYDTLACFDLFETRALQVEDAIWDAEKAVGKAELEWKEAIGLMVEIKLKLHLRTFKAWLWASATISSRTMHVPWDAAGCLCPVGDFFNYAAPREEMLNSADAITLSILSSLQDGSSDTKQQLRVQQSGGSLLRLTDGVYEEDNGAYCFYARRNYRKGEQVLLSYGTYTNLELLEHYGFLLDENPNDKAFIPLEPEMYALCSWPWDSLYINQDGKPSFALLSTMRLWATPPNQRKSVRHHAYAGSQISSDNERIVMDWMAKKCHAVLKNFPTLVCEDELLLRTINEMGDLCTVLEMEKIPPVIRDEVSAFLGCNDLMKGKKRRAVHRWRLAVEWRLKYKKMLVDCVSRCIDAVDNAISS